MPVRLNGSTSGYVDIAAPAVAGTTTVTLPSSTSTLLSSVGNQTTSGTFVMASPFTMRNKIINGAMQVWQRGTSGFTTLNTLTYVADRFWMFSGVGMNGTGSQVSSIGLTGYQYAMRVQRNSGNTATTALIGGQIIESVNCIELAGQQITVSFWARAGANYSTASNSIICAIGTGTGTDQGALALINSAWTGVAYNVVGTPTLTTSWQRFTFTFTIPAGTNEIAFYLQATPVGTAGANDYFDFTGVQLELGTAATPFEYRNYQQELAMCQRYYYRTTYGANSTTLLSGAVNNTNTAAQLGATHPVTMRASPTASFSGVTVYDGTTNTAVTSIQAQSSSTIHATINIGAAAGGLTIGRAALILAGSSAAYLDYSAEL